MIEKFSRKEIFDISVSLFLLVLSVMNAFEGGIPTSVGKLAILFPIYLFSIGGGFILHELAHRLVANGYGARAKFVMWPIGMAAMVFTSFFGFVFAAPGAVYIEAKRMRRSEYGKISIAGPLTNLAIALGFIAIAFPMPGFSINPMIFGAYINAFLAAFNLLPFGPLDGRKVMEWSFLWWAIAFILSVYMVMWTGGML